MHAALFATEACAQAMSKTHAACSHGASVVHVPTLICRHCYQSQLAGIRQARTPCYACQNPMLCMLGIQCSHILTSHVDLYRHQASPCDCMQHSSSYVPVSQSLLTVTHVLCAERLNTKATRSLRYVRDTYKQNRYMQLLPSNC